MTDEWMGEGTIILENSRSIVVLSEYMGCISISLVPRYESNLDLVWCESIYESFIETLHGAYQEAAMNKVGTDSSGSSYYTHLS